jgi:hypothetical protein
LDANAGPTFSIEALNTSVGGMLRENSSLCVVRIHYRIAYSQMLEGTFVRVSLSFVIPISKAHLIKVLDDSIKLTMYRSDVFNLTKTAKKIVISSLDLCFSTDGSRKIWNGRGIFSENIKMTVLIVHLKKFIVKNIKIVLQKSLLRRKIIFAWWWMG